jgi:hypothetical protein
LADWRVVKSGDSMAESLAASTAEPMVVMMAESSAEMRGVARVD